MPSGRAGCFGTLRVPFASGAVHFGLLARPDASPVRLPFSCGHSVRSLVRECAHGSHPPWWVKPLPLSARQRLAPRLSAIWPTLACRQRSVLADARAAFMPSSDALCHPLVRLDAQSCMSRSVLADARSPFMPSSEALCHPPVRLDAQSCMSRSMRHAC